LSRSRLRVALQQGRYDLVHDATVLLVVALLGVGQQLVAEQSAKTLFTFGAEVSELFSDLEGKGSGTLECGRDIRCSKSFVVV